MENVQIIAYRFNGDPDELMHYRTKGSINGLRRYQYRDGSLTPEGRIHYGVGKPRGEGKSDDTKPRRSLGQVINDRKVAKKRAENLAKAREAKVAKKQAAEEEAKMKAEQEAEKQRIIKTGTAAEALKIVGDLTPAEREYISNRIKWEQNMANITAQEAAAGKSKTEEFFDSMNKAVDYAQTGIKTYNTVANVVNAFNGEKVMPRIDTNIKDGNKKDIKDRKNQIKQQKEAAAKRAKQEAEGDAKRAERAKKKSEAEKTNQEKQQQNTDQSKQSKKEQKASKERTTTEEKKVYTGTVEGERTSNKNDSSERKTKSDDYYDPIDTEWRWADDTDFNAQAVYNSGRNIVAGYLEDKYR